MMLKNPASKYRPFIFPFDMSDRTWPSKTIEKAPRWLSTDLRDGNQALADPMDVEKKMRFWKTLMQIGVKEVEVGFPSASQIEFDFVRKLIEEDHVPDDVTIQVLVQAREDLILRTFESLKGAKKACIHFYNATSPLFRRVVFGLEKSDVLALAVKAAQLIKDCAAKQPDTEWSFEYSPETFSATEPDFAVEVCERVMDVWEASPEKPVILNLPATVEVSSPNIYADQIEWFCRQLTRRASAIISLHPHNDRGTGIAAAELGILAGADRIEGCLFGNGERTGNVDLVTLALNLYTQGVSPELDFSDIRSVVNTVIHCNNIPVHPRHPYAGELVFTAFSGSHQDAIKKGFAVHETRNDGVWEMPYLPIDPADLGESYEAVIRVNSQSGKGGIAWILEQDKGLKLPRRLQVDFSRKVQEIADATGKEMQAADIWHAFEDAYYLKGTPKYELVEYIDSGARRAGVDRLFAGRIIHDGLETPVTGRGNGLMAAAVDALNAAYALGIEVLDYHEHALSRGTDAKAVAYVECRTADDRKVFGVGMDVDSATASVKAILSAANAL
ncbi:2-isopropylmalate synthase [Asticcacaulis excentricus]|uniref:2-isopropylmalate synthase n=1 Tax=Asticcacaulis excentricus (strain ATCC 15261 / DSM 4724 / KCTC 12464 / NCIMB 9791 / VKM B-1370 / CB 48) TaxID=573065 RepID=E8RQJ9_ASTEC|nr:2-isopropylmalate synthase [Asticcacaulis excentricus]ADU12183.1 2-isopropylmalate synthase [Asticcacaulis excentricus CB 48]